MFYLQEQFANALVSFLKRRCPHLIGVPTEKEVPKAVQLPEETISTMLSCLQPQIKYAYIMAYLCFCTVYKNPKNNLLITSSVFICIAFCLYVTRVNDNAPFSL